MVGIPSVTPVFSDPLADATFVPADPAAGRRPGPVGVAGAHRRRRLRAGRGPAQPGPPAAPRRARPAGPVARRPRRSGRPTRQSAGASVGAGVGRGGSVAVELIARGRLLPGLTSSGADAWRLGPLDPEDLVRRQQLGAALPPEAHAGLVGLRPLRVTSPDRAVAAFSDAVADLLPRTAAPPEWLGTTPSRRCRPPTFTPASPGSGRWAADRTRRWWPCASSRRPRRWVASPASCSCRASGTPAWSSTPSTCGRHRRWCLERFGDAEAGLLLALRRAAKVWPPIGRLLDQPRPTWLGLQDEDVDELMGPVVDDLAAAGVHVLWPAELMETVELKPVVSTAPAAVTSSGLSLETLLELRWEATVGDEQLTEQELRGPGRGPAADGPLAGSVGAGRPQGAGSGPGAATGGGGRGAGRCPRRDVDRRRRDVGRGAGGPAAGPGRPAGGHRPRTGAAATPRARRRAPAVPAAGPGLDERDGRPRPRRRPGRRHGPGQDHPAHRPAPGPRRRTEAARRSSSARPRSSATGSTSCPVRPRPAGPPLPRARPGPRRPRRRRIVVTTYGIARRDARRWPPSAWGLVVADEAQEIKNPNARTARADAPHPGGARFALTGTPVENRLTELWSLLDWTTPGLLGALEAFRTDVAIPIERDRDAEVAGLARPDRPPFLLRRQQGRPRHRPRPAAEDRDRPHRPAHRRAGVALPGGGRGDPGADRQAEGIARRGPGAQAADRPQADLQPPGAVPRPARAARRPVRQARRGHRAAGDRDRGGDAALVFTQYVAMGRLLEGTSTGVASAPSSSTAR